MDDNTLATISTVEYCNLARTSANYRTLTKAILNSAKLAYDSKSLRFDDEIICALLKVMEGYDYEDKLQELQREREETLCAAVPDSTTIKV